MTKLQVLTILASLFILALLAGCSSDDHSGMDLYKVTPELRERINSGMQMVPRSEKNLFDEKFIAFLNKCDEIRGSASPYQYMETEEYQNFKQYVLSAPPTVYYLLINRYLKRDPDFFSFILNDIIDATYPETGDKIAARLHANTTILESMDLYPQVCIEVLLDEIENY